MEGWKTHKLWICNKIIFKYIKSTVELIFNKKLIKIDIYGSINSVQIHRPRLKKSAFTAESKKKKKKLQRVLRPDVDAKRKPNIQLLHCCCLVRSHFNAA